MDAHVPQRLRLRDEQGLNDVKVTGATYCWQIRTYECGPDGLVSLPTICNYLQEAASLNAEALKFSKSDFDAAGANISWVLTRLKVRMERFPAWEERVHVATWPRGGRRIVAWRDFLLTDEAGDVFGRAVTDDPAALSGSVSRLRSMFYSAGEVRGALGEFSGGSYALVWEMANEPLATAVGYYVADGGKTNSTASLDSLLGRYMTAQSAGLAVPEIVLTGRDASGLSRDFVVTRPLTVRGEGSAFFSLTKDAHIIVTNGGSLVVKSLAIGGRDGDTFVRVLGGGVLALGAGATLTNLVCSGNSDGRDPGPVVVASGGTLRLETGSMIVGCRSMELCCCGRY